MVTTKAFQLQEMVMTKAVQLQEMVMTKVVQLQEVVMTKALQLQEMVMTKGYQLQEMVMTKADKVYFIEASLEDWRKVTPFEVYICMPLHSIMVGIVCMESHLEGSKRKCKHHICKSF